MENQTIKTENHQKNAYSVFAYYDNYHRRIHVVGYAVTCILDSEAHACRPAVPSLYQTMTKNNIIRPLQSVSI